MGRQLVVLEEVVGQLGRKSRKKVYAGLEVVVVPHDVDVSAVAGETGDGHESWDEERMNVPSQRLGLALALLVQVNVSQARPGVARRGEVGIVCG
jgi:hypothetical protein